MRGVRGEERQRVRGNKRGISRSVDMSVSKKWCDNMRLNSTVLKSGEGRVRSAATIIKEGNISSLLFWLRIPVSES